MRIRIIFPGVNPNFHTIADIKHLIREDVEIDVAHTDIGPYSISSRSEEAFAVPGTLQKIVAAEREGIDAVVIDCMGDPGVAQGRELVKIPVIGPSQAAMHVASILGERFAVITMAEAVNPLVWQQAKMYRLERNLCAALSIDIPPDELSKDILLTSKLIYQQSLRAIRERGADTIIFGCCGMLGCQDIVKEKLLQDGINVPIIDPLPLAINYAEMLLRNKLSHSKRAYGTSSLKSYVGFE